MVRTAKASRKKAFRIALAEAGMTAQEWAAAEGVTPQHMYAVLSGERASKRLTDRVDAFIAKHAPAHAA